MRVLHTSDWHLGHALHDLPRDREHAAFLAWLLDTLVAEAIDALLVSGDVFDAGNPSAAALEAWYGFLAAARRRRPHLTVVAIAGNHDSPSRLTAPAPLLAAVGARVVGAVPRRSDGTIDAAALVIPLADAAGEVQAWVAAVPYLRPGDLDDVDGPRATAVRDLYAKVLAAAQAQRGPAQALLAMGHLHLVGGLGSDSERRLGGVDAGGDAGLGADVAYVALGHLHRAQQVGAAHVRYAGSPIPLSMGEIGYRHQVVVVELAGAAMSGFRTIEVPRLIELVRVPRRDAAPVADVLAELATLPDLAADADPALRPYLEVAVRLDGPAPRLRAELEHALAGKHARLVRITVARAGHGEALADAAPAEVLAQLDPREVLRRRWQRDHDGEVPAAVAAAFDQLYREVTEVDA